MKKLILLIITLVSLQVLGQQYNKNSIEFELGPTKVRDITSIKPLNFNLAYRHMFNTKFGAKVDLGYTNLEKTNIEYYNSSLSGVLNVGRLLEFESFTKNYTILLGVGGTYTHSNEHTQLLHRLSNFHLSGFIENEFKIGNDVFLHLGLDVITGVNSRPFVQTISTQTTSILNFNVGIVVALGKNKEHADWYLEDKIPVVDTLYLKPTVNNYTKIVNNNVEDITEYVFFNNNSFKVNIQGLNAIKKVVDNLKDNQVITLKGYASPPASKAYNITLSNNRCLSIKSKLISLGVSSNNIKIEVYGEINTSDSNNIDLSRCVEIKIN